MKYNLKDYQRKAVDETKKFVKAYFEIDHQTIVLKAQTGRVKPDEVLIEIVGEYSK